MEDEQTGLQEMLEEEEESRRNLEKQISTLNAQVDLPQFFFSRKKKVLICNLNTNTCSPVLKCVHFSTSSAFRDKKEAGAGDLLPGDG